MLASMIVMKVMQLSLHIVSLVLIFRSKAVLSDSVR